ncbi:MAG: pilin [Patescibacteria group bacterium]|nr:pilin [Patescibacteria group bacterium]
MNKIKIIYGLGVLSVTAPFLARGEGLVPCGPGTGGGAYCKFCDLFLLAKNVIDFLFKASFVFATVVILIAGFKLLTSAGNPEAAAGGKKMVWNALLGIVILFCAWLIIDTVLKVLTGSTSIENWGPWNTINCY